MDGENFGSVDENLSSSTFSTTEHSVGYFLRPADEANMLEQSSSNAFYQALFNSPSSSSEASEILAIQMLGDLLEPSSPSSSAATSFEGTQVHTLGPHQVFEQSHPVASVGTGSPWQLNPGDHIWQFQGASASGFGYSANNQCAK